MRSTRDRTIGILQALAVVIALLPGIGACATTPGQTVLERLPLTDDDLPPGFRFVTIPGGNRVRNQVTLDFCGASFPSESTRVARLQQSALDASGKPIRGIRGQEVVLYDSAGSAEQAFREIRNAVAECPSDRFVGSRVAGVPPLRYEVAPNAPGTIEDIAPDHIVLQFTVNGRSGMSQDVVIVYQRRGRVLVGLYGSELDAIRPFASIVARRLVTLSQADTGE